MDLELLISALEAMTKLSKYLIENPSQKGDK